jgi:DNA-binding MurR/RpiR family transcriptional regulator
MPYAKKIVLHSLSGYSMELDGLVEQFLKDDARIVAVCGVDCSTLDDIVDELVVADGSNPSRELLTSFHPDESVEEVMYFLASNFQQWGEQVDVVVLNS